MTVLPVVTHLATPLTVCCSFPSCLSPWRCRCSSHLQCQCSCPPCCHCSAWLCCCCCVSSGRNEGWRECTGPVQRRGNRQGQQDLKNLACLYRCPKKNALYDWMYWSGVAHIGPCHCVNRWIDASCFLMLLCCWPPRWCVFVFCSSDTLNSVCAAPFHFGDNKWTDQTIHHLLKYMERGHICYLKYYLSE